MEKCYLNHTKVENAPEGTITVYCYTNGLFNVCPNPFNKQASEKTEAMYYDGQFITKTTKKVTMEFIEDPSNYNP